MLSLRSDELEDIRVKLLAAVATCELEGEPAEHALTAAAHLKALSVWAETESSSLIYGSSAAIGDVLLDAINQLRAPASN